MTIDLGQTSGVLYFQGSRPSHLVFVAKLKGRYSNEYLEFASGDYELSLTDRDNKTNWYSFDWSNSYNTTKDVAGYYLLELIGDGQLKSTTLVKVINTTGIEADIVFTSPDNENNEQIIYFR